MQPWVSITCSPWLEPLTVIFIVIIGLLISLPIVIFGSTLVIKLIDRFPIIIYLGAMVIAFTAGSMIAGEPILHSLLSTSPYLEWIIIAVIVLGVFISGKLKMQRKVQANS